MDMKVLIKLEYWFWRQKTKKLSVPAFIRSIDFIGMN